MAGEPARASAPASAGEEQAREIAADTSPGGAVASHDEAARSDDGAPSDEGGLEEEFDHPSGPLIAPSFGTEEMVRGEEHRDPIEKRANFARGRERERHRRGRPGERRGEQRDGRGEQRTEGRGGDKRGAEKRGGEQRGAEQRATEKRGGEKRGGEKRGGEQRGGEQRGGEQRGGEQRGSEQRGERRPEEARRETAPTSTAPATPTPSGSAPAPVQPTRGAPEGRTGSEPNAVEAAIEILRGTDGRPIHVRQIVEMAMKRRLLRGDLGDLMRVMRGAIVVDAREREAAGLRPRVRAAGGSSYQLADRRLEPELAQQERDLGERAARLGEATRQALLRRLGKLPPHAFEALMRLLVARLGISDIELVKRGDGVAYFGGERAGEAVPAASTGEAARRRRVLIGVRPGDAELTRRAVGELRAGLKARNYDEGLLLAAGRIGDEALAELGENGGAVSVHDADELASLCLRHGVGASRRAVPVDVLDVDLLGDLAEA